MERNSLINGADLVEVIGALGQNPEPQVDLREGT